MNVIPIALAAHYDKGTTTLATCWKVTRTDDQVFGFTNTDRNLKIGGVTYEAATGFTPSAVASSGDMAVDNLEVTGILDSFTITEADLMAGLWDFATVEIFEVNYADLSMGVRKIRKGTIGEVSVNRSQFTAELRGMMQQLQQTQGELYSPSCRADLGDSRCKINLTSYTVAGTITSVTDKRIFADSGRAEASGYFDGGKLTFTSGENKGLSMEVKTFASGGFVLHLPMPYTVAAGDAYTVYPGCKKRFTEDCVGKFNNAVNFRGEPHVPGNDQMMKVGGA